MTMSQRMWKREQERKKRERMKRARRRRNCAIIVLFLAVATVVAIIMLSRDKNDSKPVVEVTESPVSVAVDSRVLSDPYTTTRGVDDIKQSFFADSAFAGNALAQTIGMYGILKETDFYAGVNVDLENVYTMTTYGSTTSIAEQFKSKRFSKVFLSFGENELKKMTASEFKAEYVALIEDLQEYQPNARIYLIAIPPVTAETSAAYDGKLNINRIQEFNKRIMSMAVDFGLFYIDSVEALGDNKSFLPKGVSADGINLNKAAVIDLLYYAVKESYVPDLQSLANFELEEDSEEDAEEDNVPTPVKPQAPAPSPTVNVFKDSVKDKRDKTE